MTNYEIFDAGNGYFFLHLQGVWYYWKSGFADWVLYPIENSQQQNMSFMQWAKDHGTITQRPSTPATYIAGRKVHGGWDIAALPIGKPIHAFRGGKVVGVTSPPSGWGYSVEIQDSSKNLHRYAHFTGLIVNKGDMIKKGQVVGYMGKSGTVFGKTGIHLHYEVKRPNGTLIMDNDFDSIPN